MRPGSSSDSDQRPLRTAFRCSYSARSISPFAKGSFEDRHCVRAGSRLEPPNEAAALPGETPATRAHQSYCAAGKGPDDHTGRHRRSRSDLGAAARLKHESGQAPASRRCGGTTPGSGQRPAAGRGPRQGTPGGAEVDCNSVMVLPAERGDHRRRPSPRRDTGPPAPAGSPPKLTATVPACQGPSALAPWLARVHRENRHELGTTASRPAPAPGGAGCSGS